jgi:DNA-binding XRE family transcriptional regulator
MTKPKTRVDRVLSLDEDWPPRQPITLADQVAEARTADWDFTNAATAVAARATGTQAAGDAALALHALRKRRGMSQEQLAVKLAVGRQAVCKLERRADMHVSNLRRYIEALSGTLEIIARFPDGAVAIAGVGEAPA